MCDTPTAVFRGLDTRTPLFSLSASGGSGEKRMLRWLPKRTFHLSPEPGTSSEIQGSGAAGRLQFLIQRGCIRAGLWLCGPNYIPESGKPKGCFRNRRVAPTWRPVQRPACNHTGHVSGFGEGGPSRHENPRHPTSKFIGKGSYMTIG